MAKPKLTYKMDGTEKIVQRFNEIATKAEQETKDHVNRTAIDVQKGAKRRAPVDDGDLRASIVIEPFLSGFSIDVGSELPYATYQEFGTGIYAEHPSIPGRQTPWTFKHPKTGKWITMRGFKAQPFLRPAFDAVKNDFYQGIERIYKNL